MKKNGITLIELIVVLSIISILSLLAVATITDWQPRYKMESNASKLLEDIKWSQIEAEKFGNYEIIGGQMRMRRVYFVIEPSERRYRIYRWQDDNGNSVPESGEFGISFIKEVRLDSNIEFSFESNINRIGCSNALGNPSGGLVNLLNCPASICGSGMCNCLRFNGKGFYEGMNGAAIYLTNQRATYALNINRTGIVTMCRWDSNKGQWINVR